MHPLYPLVRAAKYLGNGRPWELYAGGRPEDFDWVSHALAFERADARAEAIAAKIAKARRGARDEDEDEDEG